MTTQQIKDKLVIAGIKNLNEFGYPYVTKETILTDEVYKGFFKSMLNYNKGNGGQIDKAIDELLVVVTNGS
jgi:hypothetical protein